MSKIRDAVNGSNFKKRCSAVVRSGKSIRGNIQELAQYAMVNYLDPANNGNTGDMTYLITQVASVKSLNHKLLGQFIEDTVNVKLTKTSEGGVVFKKAVKGETPALHDDADVSSPWWEHGRSPEVKAVDILKSLESMLKTFENSQGEGAKRPLADGQQCVFDDVTARLKELKTWTEGAISIRNAAMEAEAGTVIQEVAAA